MLTRKNEQSHSIHEFMRGGRQQVRMAALSSKLPEKVKLYSVLTLEPGASIGYHKHTGESEMVLVLEGCGHMQDDDRCYDVCSGDCVVVFSGHSHGIENLGDSDLVLLCTIVRD